MSGHVGVIFSPEQVLQHKHVLAPLGVIVGVRRHSHRTAPHLEVVELLHGGRLNNKQTAHEHNFYSLYSSLVLKYRNSVA